MSILPALKPKELLSALLKAGFKIVRQSGSHIRLQHPQDLNRQTSIPLHNTDLPRWLVREILKQTEISVKTMLELLRK